MTRALEMRVRTFELCHAAALDLAVTADRSAIIEQAGLAISMSILNYFSGLKHIKTAFRSSMTAQRLSGLTLLHVHRDLPIDIAAAVDEFSRRHPRRMRMVDILSANSN